MLNQATPRWASLFGPSLFDLLALPSMAPATSRASPVGPALNLWTQDQTAYLEAELPGVAAADLSVSVTGDVLTLSGSRPAFAEAGVTIQRRERPVGEFRRVVRLPFEVDADALSAQLINGVLTIRLPAVAAARPRVIPVRAGESCPAASSVKPASVKPALETES